MLFEFVIASKLKEGDLIAMLGGDTSADILLVQEINEAEEVDGYDTVEVRGILFTTDRTTTNLKCSPVPGFSTVSKKFKVRGFPSILLLREGTITHEEGA